MAGLNLLPLKIEPIVICSCCFVGFCFISRNNFKILYMPGPRFKHGASEFSIYLSQQLKTERCSSSTEHVWAKDRTEDLSAGVIIKSKACVLPFWHRWPHSVRGCGCCRSWSPLDCETWVLLSRAVTHKHMHPWFIRQHSTLKLCTAINRIVNTLNTII